MNSTDEIDPENEVNKLQESNTLNEASDEKNLDKEDEDSKNVENFPTQASVSAEKSEFVSETDCIIGKTLNKVKEYFKKNQVDEEKLAEFMFKVLTINQNMNVRDTEMDSNVIEELITPFVEPSSTDEDKMSKDIFTHMLNNFIGLDTARLVCEKFCTENVDDIFERVLGEDTKNMVCDRLGSNLDELLNNLIDEMLFLKENPNGEHPVFDDFINKLLGDDTKRFLMKTITGQEEIDELQPIE